jgi:hypothetical protein
MSKRPKKRRKPRAGERHGRRTFRKFAEGERVGRRSDQAANLPLDRAMKIPPIGGVGKSARQSAATTPFASWVAAMGYNRKQVAEAGARVGLSAQTAGHRNRGETDMNQLELMGLTAAYFSLPAWRPDLAAKLDDRARTMMQLAREDIERCLVSNEKARRAR